MVLTRGRKRSCGSINTVDLTANKTPNSITARQSRTRRKSTTAIDSSTLSPTITDTNDSVKNQLIEKKEKKIQKEVTDNIASLSLKTKSREKDAPKIMSLQIVNDQTKTDQPEEEKEKETAISNINEPVLQTENKKLEQVAVLSIHKLCIETNAKCHEEQQYTSFSSINNTNIGQCMISTDNFTAATIHENKTDKNKTIKNDLVIESTKKNQDMHIISTEKELDKSLRDVPLDWNNFKNKANGRNYLGDKSLNTAQSLLCIKPVKTEFTFLRNPYGSAQNEWTTNENNYSNKNCNSESCSQIDLQNILEKKQINKSIDSEIAYEKMGMVSSAKVSLHKRVVVTDNSNGTKRTAENVNNEDNQVEDICKNKLEGLANLKRIRLDYIAHNELRSCLLQQNEKEIYDVTTEKELIGNNSILESHAENYESRQLLNRIADQDTPIDNKDAITVVETAIISDTNQIKVDLIVNTENVMTTQSTPAIIDIINEHKISPIVQDIDVSSCNAITNRPINNCYDVFTDHNNPTTTPSSTTTQAGSNGAVNMEKKMLMDFNANSKGQEIEFAQNIFQDNNCTRSVNQEATVPCMADDVSPIKTTNVTTKLSIGNPSTNSTASCPIREDKQIIAFRKTSVSPIGAHECLLKNTGLEPIKVDTSIISHPVHSNVNKEIMIDSDLIDNPNRDIRDIKKYHEGKGQMSQVENKLLTKETNQSDNTLDKRELKFNTSDSLITNETEKKNCVLLTEEMRDNRIILLKKDVEKIVCIQPKEERDKNREPLLENKIEKKNYNALITPKSCLDKNNITKKDINKFDHTVFKGGDGNSINEILLKEKITVGKGITVTYQTDSSKNIKRKDNIDNSNLPVENHMNEEEKRSWNKNNHKKLVEYKGNTTQD
eukprot:Ihof_evm5s122 gene=Ihof_evmTU5s122